MADNEKSDRKPFAVCIELSQREPIVRPDSDPLPSDTWRFNLFGHFDDMKIEIKDDLRETYRKRYDDLPTLDTNKRMNYNAETKNLFFYVEEESKKDDLRILLDDISRDESEYSGKKRPMIALIAIKLRHQFFGRPLPCNPCDCIESFLRKQRVEHDASADFFAMRALNIYDVYVLIRTDDPNFVLRCAHNMQYHVCDFTGCNGNSDGDCKPHKTDEEIIKIARKSADNLEGRLSSLEVEAQKHPKLEKCVIEVNEIIKKINDDCATSKKMLAEKKKILFPYGENIIGSLTSKLHECQEAEKSFEQKELLLKLINIVRACGEMPLILQTYTIIGRNEKLEENCLSASVKEKTVLFELQMQLHPGSAVEDIKSGVTEHFKKVVPLEQDKQKIQASIHRFLAAQEENEPIQKQVEEIFEYITMLFEEKTLQSGFEFNTVLGRYYFVCRGIITLDNLLKLYDLDDLNWHNHKPSRFQYTSGRFLLNVEHREGPKLLVKMKNQMFKEDTAQADSWLEERHQNAADLFTKIDGYKLENDFPFLRQMLRKISLLHMQGCRRMFYALSWREFRDASEFFKYFLEKLRSVFYQIHIMKQAEQLYKEEERTNKLAHYAGMAYESMRIFLKKMTDLSHDRMILDIYMHENTRPGVYATGAYEKLLIQYTGWINYLIELLGRLENNNLELSDKQNDIATGKSLHFVLVPVDKQMIYSYLLFPQDEGTSTLAIYEMSLDIMLDVGDALPILIHETGHYLGVVNRIKHALTYLHMVAYCYAMRFSRSLRMSRFVPIITDAVDKINNNLYAAIAKYLIECFKKEFRKKPATNSEVFDLDQIAYRCRVWLERVRKIVLSDPSKIGDPNIGLIIKCFVDIYNVLGAAPLAAINGRLLGLLADDAMEANVDNCRELLQECYADLIMIYVLHLDETNYLDVLTKSFMDRDQLFEAKTTDEDRKSRQFTADALRAFSALVVIEYKKYSEANTKLEDILKNTATAVKKKELSSGDNKAKSELYNNMKKLVEAFGEKKEDFTPNDLLVAWRFALMPYLFESGKEIKNGLVSLGSVEEEELKGVRERFEKIKEGKGLHSLVTFLEEGDNV